MIISATSVAQSEVTNSVLIRYDDSGAVGQNQPFLKADFDYADTALQILK